jgi:hypothetical protein
MIEPVSKIETYQKADEAIRIFRSAVRKAQEESRRFGVPNVYSINGILHYEMPNGELTTVRPEAILPARQDPEHRDSH